MRCLYASPSPTPLAVQHGHHVADMAWHTVCIPHVPALTIPRVCVVKEASSKPASQQSYAMLCCAVVFEPRYLELFRSLQASTPAEAEPHFGHILAASNAPPALMQHIVGGLPPLGVCATVKSIEDLGSGRLQVGTLLSITTMRAPSALCTMLHATANTSSATHTFASLPCLLHRPAGPSARPPTCLPTHSPTHLLSHPHASLTFPHGHPTTANPPAQLTARPPPYPPAGIVTGPVPGQPQVQAADSRQRHAALPSRCSHMAG